MDCIRVTVNTCKKRTQRLGHFISSCTDLSTLVEDGRHCSAKHVGENFPSQDNQSWRQLRKADVWTAHISGRAPKSIACFFFSYWESLRSAGSSDDAPPPPPIPLNFLYHTVEWLSSVWKCCSRIQVCEHVLTNLLMSLFSDTGPHHLNISLPTSLALLLLELDIPSCHDEIMVTLWWHCVLLQLEFIMASALCHGVLQRKAMLMVFYVLGEWPPRPCFMTRGYLNMREKPLTHGLLHVKAWSLW